MNNIITSRMQALAACLSTVWLLAPAVPLSASVLPGTRMDVNWQSLISTQDITSNTRAVDSYQGLLLGNGDIAVSLYGPPELLALHVGKNDLWDYRGPMDAKRPRTHANFLRMYADPAKPAVSNYLYDRQVDDWNVDIRETSLKPMPTKKPAGTIRFRNASLAGKGYTGRLHLWNADVTAGPDSDHPTLRARVSYPRNLIIAEYDPAGTGAFDIELARHKDSTGTIPNGPEFGVDGRDMWVRYKFPPDPVNYPNGFEYVMYSRILGGDDVSIKIVPDFAKIMQGIWRGQVATEPVETTEGAAVAHVRSTKPVTLLVAVVTTRDDIHPIARAKSDLDKAQSVGTKRLIEEHETWWHSFWQRSFVCLPDKPFLNKTWSFSQYMLACCWRKGRIAPGLFGSWAWEDYPLFGNDYHWDYNMQQAVWGAYSSNHLEQAIPYNETVRALFPTAVTDARETYGIEGAKYFLVSYPRQYAHNPFPLLHYDKMMSLNGWVTHPMWWYFLYSQDRTYLKTQAYPVMRECARFYEKYLTRAADGKYDVWPTAAWDVDFTPHLKDNRNFPMDISLIRNLMNACVSASEILGVDEEMRTGWRRIAMNLRDYPTAETAEGKVYTAYEGSTSSYHFPLAAMMVFPGDDIGLHSPQAQIEIARRTVAPMTYSGDEQLLKAMIRARLGVDDLDTFENQLKTTTRPNGTLSYAGQWFFWVHGAGNSIWLNENLLQSYDGRIHVAPVKLKTGAWLYNLRTVGAFLVSAEIRSGGRIAYITITSEAGKTCNIEKPWTGNLRIRELPSMDEISFDNHRGVVAFQTKKGAVYIIDRPSEPWEKQPLTHIPAH
jgi:alpha-L-fucosidase 2